MGALTQLTMRFFGTFQVSWGEKEITRFRSTNVQALLLYLVLHADRPLSRDFLATLLWPDEADKVASTNFRQALYQLWKLLPDKQLPQPIFHVTRQMVLAITAATLRNLSALLGKSLLRRAGGGRYELHEVIREFSDDKLQQLAEPF